MSPRFYVSCCMPFLVPNKTLIHYTKFNFFIMSNRVDGSVVLDNITEKISRKDQMKEKKKND